MSANVPANGPIRQLDKQAEPEEQVQPKDLEDQPRIARLLMRILRDIATLKRRWAPNRIDHEDKVVDATGTTLYRLPHNFGGRVRWWVVDWQCSTAAAPALRRDASSDDNTLVLTSGVAGTATIRIEEAG